MVFPLIPLPIKEAIGIKVYHLDSPIDKNIIEVSINSTSYKRSDAETKALYQQLSKGFH